MLKVLLMSNGNKQEREKEEKMKQTNRRGYKDLVKLIIFRQCKTETKYRPIPAVPKKKGGGEPP
jgi:hypothetical protein